MSSSETAASSGHRLGIRYVGGPTALLRVAGLHLLTDPTFDPPGDHPVGDRVLHKTAGPAVVPLHFEGWGHFTQGRHTLVDAFAGAGLGDRLRLPEPGGWVEP